MCLRLTHFLRVRRNYFSKHVDQTCFFFTLPDRPPPPLSLDTTVADDHTISWQGRRPDQSPLLLPSRLLPPPIPFFFLPSSPVRRHPPCPFLIVAGSASSPPPRRQLVSSSTNFFAPSLSFPLAFPTYSPLLSTCSTAGDSSPSPASRRLVATSSPHALVLPSFSLTVRISLPPSLGTIGSCGRCRLGGRLDSKSQ